MTRPLRLIEVGLSWPPEAFITLKLRRLAQRGVDVRVGAFHPPEPAPPLAGLRLERLPFLADGLEPLLRALNRLRPDVLHFEWMTVASTCLPLLEAWRGPVVVSCRGSELPAGTTANGRPPAAAIAGVFARADAVHVVAEAKRDEAVEFGLDPSKANLIRGGIDTEEFRPAEADRDAEPGLRIVSVGWLRWLKGYEYALLAIAELAAEGVPVTFDIVGGDPPLDMNEESERERILHTARSLGLDGRVHLHGHLEPSEVAATLRRADVLLHASLSEGLPNVVLEGMASGLPVVATDVGGTREAVRDGVEGMIVPPRDPQAVAAALRSLWHDPELRERMGRAGRARAEAEFTIERLTTQWVELYERVVRDAAARPTDGAAAVEVIPPTHVRKPLPEPPAGTPLRLLGAGPLSWTQGYEFALGAMSLLRRRGIPCEYRIAGEGPHVDAVAFARHQLGLDECVELAAEAPPGELRDHLSWADVLVDASLLREPRHAVLEAQAAGVPVVTTNPPEDAPESVLAVPGRDPAALGDALAALAQDPSLRDRIVRAGRERALAAPTSAIYAEVPSDA